MDAGRDVCVVSPNTETCYRGRWPDGGGHGRGDGRGRGIEGRYYQESVKEDHRVALNQTR